MFILSGCMYDTSNPGGTTEIDGKKYYSGEFFAMGTIIKVGVFATNQASANKVYDGVKEIYLKYDEVADDGYDSLYGQEETELALLNEKRELEVSPELLELLKFAVDLQEKTDGYYNPFMGTLNHKYKDFINGKSILPSQGEAIYYSSVARSTSLIFEGNKVKIVDGVPGEYAQIDLGGIAKGYATQKAYEYLVANDVTDYIINAGSSNILVGNYPGKEKWKIAISNPNKDSEMKFVAEYELENMAIVTSSPAEQNRLYNGKLYHHILNPYTGFPAGVDATDGDVVEGVTIFGQDSGMLDAMSTAICAMGKKKGIEYVEKNNINAIFVAEDKIIYEN